MDFKLVSLLNFLFLVEVKFKFLEVNICNSIRVVAYAVCFVLPGSNFCFGVSFQDSKEFSEYFMVAIFI
jgi:hypothetical protein